MQAFHKTVQSEERLEWKSLTQKPIIYFLISRLLQLYYLIISSLRLTVRQDVDSACRVEEGSFRQKGRRFQAEFTT